MNIPFFHGVPGTVATLMSALLLSMTVITAPVEAARIPLKNGQKIGFMGDSITEAGVEPQGYVTLRFPRASADTSPTRCSSGSITTS